jgi:hypothetical protein
MWSRKPSKRSIAVMWSDIIHEDLSEMRACCFKEDADDSHALRCRRASLERLHEQCSDLADAVTSEGTVVL